MNPKLEKEIVWVNSDEFVLGEFIYMAMALVKGKRVCIAVAYKIDYCIKKAREFEKLDSNVIFTHVNKVRVGELMECDKFKIS